MGGKLAEKGMGQIGPKASQNVDLWKKLLQLKEPHQMTFHWVKGHDGHPQNERCDTLATKAADGDNLFSDERLC